MRDQAAAGELSLVLEVGQQVGQFDVAFVEDDGAEVDRFRRFHAGPADGKIGLAPVQAGLGDRRRFADGLDAVLNQPLVVEQHPVGGLVLDAIPEGLELLAVEHGLPGLDRSCARRRS